MRTLTTYPTHPHPLLSTTTVTLIPALLATLASALISSSPTILTTCAYRLSAALLSALKATYTLFSLLSTSLTLLSTSLLLPSTLYLLSAAKWLGDAGYKKTEKWREDCFYAFLVWILNPNALLLVLLHPGWVLVGGAWWVWG